MGFHGSFIGSISRDSKFGDSFGDLTNKHGGYKWEIPSDLIVCQGKSPCLSSVKHRNGPISMLNYQGYLTSL